MMRKIIRYLRSRPPKERASMLRSLVLGAGFVLLFIWLTVSMGGRGDGSEEAELVEEQKGLDSIKAQILNFPR